MSDTSRYGDTPTKRELEALSGLSRGLTNVEIGQEIFLSANTVKTHLVNLYRKLGAKDRSHAVTIGFQRGYLDPPDGSGWRLEARLAEYERYIVRLEKRLADCTCDHLAVAS